MKTVLLIFNKRSGKGMIRQKLADIVDVFGRYGYEVTAHSTRGRGEATEFVKKRAKDFDLVVCCGGDGTLNETVKGLIQSRTKTPLGYIPAGSTNDFASSVGIPKGPVNAAKTAANGVPFLCDVGSFNGRTFVYTAAFGILSDVPYRTKQKLKNAVGHFAYLLESVREFAVAPFGIYPWIDMKVSVNGEELEDTFVYGMITNSVSIGGVQGVTGNNVKMDDGLLEVTLIKRPALAVSFPFIFASLLHLLKRSRHVYTYKTDHIRIRSKKPVAWTLDGESGGKWKDVEIRCVQHAVKIMVKK